MSWTEPPWSGWIATTGDALIMLEAARRGVIPRVTRRLVDAERKMICSGSVFVFDEDESGIKRWTDGLFWSPSRILGNFLLYRETDKRGAGHRKADNKLKGAAAVAGGDGDHSQAHGQGSGGDPNADGIKSDEAPGEHDDAADGSLARPKTEGARAGGDRVRERTLMGSLTNSYKFKSDGLMKKTFSLTIAGVSQHLISYYKPADVESGRLRTPSSVPELAALEIAAEYLDKTHFRIPPRIDVGRDGRMRYVGEAEDEDDGGAGTGSSLGNGGVGVIGSRGLLQDVPIGPDMNSMAGLGGLSSMSSMSSMGGTSPTTSRRAKRMEPYPTLQGLSDPGMAGGSSGLGTKRRRRTNTNPNSTSSQPSQGQGQTQSHSLGHVHPPPPALMGMTMSMTDGGAGMYTQSPTTSPRSIGVGLSPAHSHGGNGGSSPEDGTGTASFVYPASSAGTLGYYAQSYGYHTGQTGNGGHTGHPGHPGHAGHGGYDTTSAINSASNPNGAPGGSALGLSYPGHQHSLPMSGTQGSAYQYASVPAPSLSSTLSGSGGGSGLGGGGGGGGGGQYSTNPFAAWSTGPSQASQGQGQSSQGGLYGQGPSGYSTASSGMTSAMGSNNPAHPHAHPSVSTPRGHANSLPHANSNSSPESVRSVGHGHGHGHGHHGSVGSHGGMGYGGMASAGAGDERLRR